MFRYLPFIALIFMLLTSCQKQRENGEDPGLKDRPGNIPGMGEAGGALTGIPFELPSGFRIAGEMRGRDYLLWLDSTAFCKLSGSGRNVMVEMVIINETGKDTVLTLPAGLTFRSANPLYQHGIIIRETKIPLRKDGSCQTAVLAYCINAKRRPSSPENMYEFGPISQSPPIVEIIQLLKDKPIHFGQMEYAEGIYLMADIQEIIWKVTDGKGMDEDDRDYLKYL